MPAVHVRIRGAHDGLRPDSRRALLLRLRHGLLRPFCPRPGASVPCLAQARCGNSVWQMALVPSFVPWRAHAHNRTRTDTRICNRACSSVPFSM